MNTLHKICVNVRNISQNGGVSTDDSRISLRNIAYWVDYYREQDTLIRTDYGKEYTMLSQIEQDLGCLSLSVTDKGECGSWTWGEKIKLICDMPIFLDMPDNRAITFVGLIDKGIGFQYATAQQLSVKSKTAMFEKFSYWFNIGNKFYIKPADKYKDIECINVRGVIKSPQDIDSRYNPDLDIAGKEKGYPLLSGSEQQIVSLILQRELGFSLQTISDITNDSKQD
jgi:hypothetical protein